MIFLETHPFCLTKGIVSLMCKKTKPSLQKRLIFSKNTPFLHKSQVFKMTKYKKTDIFLDFSLRTEEDCICCDVLFMV